MPPRDSPKLSDVRRVVTLGASNLTLGLSSVLSTARRAFGSDLEFLTAHGYGRSYGAPSRVAMRTLPGILESGLWRELENRPPVPTRALILDVGNDIVYGFEPGRILGWVEEAASRLRSHTKDVVLTDLPRTSIRRLTPATFLFFRALFYPSSRVSLTQVLDRADELNEGLAELARSKDLRFVRLDPDWYGFDPIHLRPRVWARAWKEIVAPDADPERTGTFSPVELARVHLLAPERRLLLGHEQRTPQSGTKLRRGGRLWIY